MNIELTNKEFRRLLDLVYIGNWILNSTRGDDRIPDYDDVESRVFSYAPAAGMGVVTEYRDGAALPSEKFENGGIYEAIADYEDTVFFEILAEELARRDMGFEPVSPENMGELTNRIDEYIEEFEENGMDHIVLEK
ncbi:MAG: hypothetical protein LBN99_00140 [Oscillospiraceae bacterium]|jgi:hypothetical protein|nr:hypothetical protein [Oscillospiraceae bacterium]